MHKPTLSNSEKISCKLFLDDPIKPSNWDHLVEKKRYSQGHGQGFWCCFNAETVPLSLEEEQEDNIKAPATKKVTTSKEENREVYYQEQFHIPWEQIKSLLTQKWSEEITTTKYIGKLLLMQTRWSCNQELPKRNRSEGFHKLVDDLAESIVNFWPGNLWNYLGPTADRVVKQSQTTGVGTTGKST